jgi:putative phosphoribosyl transferase
MGAIGSGNIQVLNHQLIKELNIPEKAIRQQITAEQRELERREHEYRDNRPPPAITGKTIILVDDGLATGASMRAAVTALNIQSPARMIVAVPAAAPQAVDLLQSKVDEIIYVIAPDPFEGVGKWYKDFSQTTDEEVHLLLEAANQH